MEKEEEVDRRGRKTILMSEHGWSLPAKIGLWKTGQDGKGYL